MTDILRAILVLSILIMIILIPNIKLVQPNKAYIIERLGRYFKTLDNPGIYFLIPFIDRTLEIIDLSEQKDHIHVKDDSIDTVITYTYQITDAKAFCYTTLNSLGEIEEIIKESVVNQSLIETKALNEISQEYGVTSISVSENNNK